MQIYNDTQSPSIVHLDSTEEAAPTTGQAPIGSDPALPPEKPKGDEDLLAPDSSTAPINPAAMKELAATLSPGAWLAILCVKDAAKENEESVKEVLSHVDLIKTKLNEEAENIMKGAVAQLVCSVGMSAISMGFTVVGGIKTLRLDSSLQGVAASQAMVAPNNWNASAKALEQLGGSVGGFVNTFYQSKNKELDATVENSKAMIENLRTHVQSQHDLMAKSLDFFNTMQANMNQTRSRIMG